MRADGKPIDGRKPDRYALFDRNVRLISHDSSQRQLDFGLEVNVRRQVKVRVTWLGSDDVGDDSGDSAVDDAEC